MVKIPFILFALLFSFNTFAQTGRVTIQCSSDKPLQYISIYRRLGLLGLTAEVDTISKNDKQQFIAHFNISKPESIYLIYGDKGLRLWLEPNTTISVHLTDNIPIVKGALSSYANYYLNEQVNYTKLKQEYKNRNPGYNKGDAVGNDNYFTIEDSITQKRLSFLTAYFANQKLSHQQLSTDKESPSNLHSDQASSHQQLFIDQERASILFLDLYYKTASDDWDASKFKYFQDKLNSTNKYTYGFSDQLTFDNRKLLSLEPYQRMLNSIIIDMAHRKIKELGKSFSIELYVDNALATIDKFSVDPVCNLANKAIILNAVVDDIKNRKKLEWVDKLYRTIAKLSLNDPNHFLSDVKIKLDLVVQDTRFVRGSKAPDFLLTDLAGNEHYLHDFKGKKIYLDIWAVWCPHCIELMPDWDKLVKSYSGNDDVVFLSVSLDDKIDTWKQYIKIHPHKGTVLYAGAGGVNSAFGKSYSIVALPQFMLIDENGNMLSYSAPQPDKPEILKNLFDINK